jgi:hypothetical protein
LYSYPSFVKYGFYLIFSVLWMLHCQFYITVKNKSVCPCSELHAMGVWRYIFVHYIYITIRVRCMVSLTSGCFPSREGVLDRLLVGSRTSLNVVLKRKILTRYQILLTHLIARHFTAELSTLQVKIWFLLYL